MALVFLEQSDGAAVIRISRPEKRNALTLFMLEEVARLAERAAAEGAVAVVLTGGDEAFSGGVDLDELGRGAADLNVDGVLAATVARLRAIPVPLVIAIEGACVGGAVELALCGDARVVAEGGFFAVPATRLGLLYRPEALATMVAVVGRETVARLLLFNERMEAAEALAGGLATHVCARGTALASALTLCEGVSRETSGAVRATKELLAELLGADDDLAHWSDRREQLLDSEERREALRRAGTHRAEGG